MKKYESKEEVHNLARKIINVPFGELADKYGINLKNTKNSIGDLFEAYFGKEKDSASEPDLGVAELKATPYKKLKRGSKYSAKERLVLNIINYDELVNETFEDSHFLHKNKVIELAFYEYFKNKPRDKWFFSNVALFEMSKNPVDYKIIKHDWEVIYNYVNEGKADKLSESLTNYLSACTKGKNKKSTRPQPHSNIPAKQRAFSFKTGYMTQILRKNILGDEDNDAIIKNPIEIKNKSLRELIIERFEPYIGKDVISIANELGIQLKTGEKFSKNLNNMVARRMLGLSKGNKLDNISELDKGSFIMKTIQFNARGINKESMSFPKFNYQDLVSQTWENKDGEPKAELNIMFRESTFIFLVFQYNEKGFNIFKGVKFFQVPERDIEGPIKHVWEDTVRKLKEGVKLTYHANRQSVSNNLTSLSDNAIIHVRPHAKKSSYINNSSSNKLPVQARWTNWNEARVTNKYPLKVEYMTTSSFWLNNSYIRQAVKSLITK